jgi:FdhD protein
VSFELVQKAVAARVPILAGISAPTSLAVRMAEALGVTVVGFVRGETMNVYSHPRRVA